MARNTEALARWRAFAKPFQEKHGFKRGLVVASEHYRGAARTNPESTTEVVKGIELGSGAAIGLAVVGFGLAWLWSKACQGSNDSIPIDPRFLPPRSY